MSISTEGKLTIGFRLQNECGDMFSQDSTLEVFDDLGDTDFDVIGDQLNCFLKQCGYYRPNDNIFMESLTDEEYDAVAEFLEKFREEKKSCESQ